MSQPVRTIYDPITFICLIQLIIWGHLIWYMILKELKVADIVWNKIKSKDVRDILTIGKLSKNVDDVDFIATTLQKYKRRNEE